MRRLRAPNRHTRLRLIGWAHWAGLYALFLVATVLADGVWAEIGIGVAFMVAIVAEGWIEGIAREKLRRDEADEEQRQAMLALHEQLAAKFGPTVGPSR